MAFQGNSRVKISLEFVEHKQGVNCPKRLYILWSKRLVLCQFGICREVSLKFVERALFEPFGACLTGFHERAEYCDTLSQLEPLYMIRGFTNILTSSPLETNATKFSSWSLTLNFMLL